MKNKSKGWKEKEQEEMKRTLLFAVLMCVMPVAAAAQPPNIIYILTDDLGYGDLGCYGSKLNLTPNIDKLATNGIRLTDFHAASWCAPSRRSLMTGCHPNRPGPIGPRITIAEMLKQRGYATALIGKWHLGMSKGTHPLDQGFDYWLGTKGSNDWDGPKPNYGSFKNAPESDWKTPLLKNRDVLERACPQSSFTQKYTTEAVRIINENKDTPFFIYLAHNMPHVPIFASERFKGKSDNGVLGDVLMELDWSTGEIVKAIEAAGIRDNTLIVFTSDNGPWTMFKEFGGIATPLR
ncbi:MAG: sulfatase-like hydrolase/transferase, partial [Methanosarcinaceae archaeon]|nr:sulfatase-like hydrolase/transferase [Methanosarcinaceae archaeon]